MWATTTDLYKKSYKESEGFEMTVTATRQADTIHLTLSNTGLKNIKVLQFVWCNFPESIQADFVLQVNEQKSLSRNMVFNYYLLLEYVIEYYPTPNHMDIDKKHFVNEKSFVDEIGKTKTSDAFADATLVCEGEEIRCHRVILAARSRLFKKVFTQNCFKEGASKQFEVKGMPLETLKAMIDYIYSDQLDEETDISALFSAAHLYGINKLVTRCMDIMIEDLDVENAAEFFLKGFLMEQTPLKTAAMDFITKNFAEIKETDGWSNFMKARKSSKALEEILEFALIQ